MNLRNRKRPERGVSIDSCKDAPLKLESGILHLAAPKSSGFVLLHAYRELLQKY
jgi:hypothetical protein